MTIQPAPWIVPREELISRLIERVMTHKIVLIRGTPASGKSVLMGLLASTINATLPSYRVITVSTEWPKTLRTTPECVGHMNAETGVEYRTLLSSREVFLLWDEAQSTYASSWFWSTFLKDTSNITGPYVVLFASYGSPAGSPVEASTFIPPHLSPLQRIGLQWSEGDPFSVGLLMTEAESRDLIMRRLKAEFSLYDYEENLIKAIVQMAGGHTGVLSGIVSAIGGSIVSQRSLGD